MGKEIGKEIKTINDLPGVGPQAAEKLIGAGYKTLEAMAVASPMELIEAASLGQVTAEKAIKAARDALEMGFETADKLAEKRKLVGRITTGSKEVDSLLGGGIETQSITEIYGKFASGKSQWCFETAVTVQLPVEKGGLGGNCLYIDSENSFRPERVIQVANHLGMDQEKVLKNIFVARAYTSDHQMLLADKADEMVKQKKIKLVIVDSLMAQFRSEYVGRGTLATRQQKLNKHLRTLMKLAEMNNIAVLVTNQVMQRPDILFGDPTAPVGGEVLAHACLAPNTFIQGGNGQISQIEEFTAENVYSTDFKKLEGETSAVSCKSKRDDIKETYLIDTGYQIEASPNHGFFKLDGFEIKEVKAKEIKKGDYVLQAGTIDIENEVQEIPKIKMREFVMVNKQGAELIKNSIQNMGFTREEFCQEMPFGARDLRAHLNQGQPMAMQNMQALVDFGVGPEAMQETTPVFNHKHRPLTMPEEFSQEIAQATGYFLGDGNLDKASLRFRDERREILETYNQLFKEIFNIDGKISKVKDKNCWQLSINSKEIKELFTFIKRNYISLIAASPKPVVKSFIRGFVDAEGYVDKAIRRVSVAQKDKEILQIIQMLLLRFGIKSKIRVCGIKKPFPMLDMFSEDVVKYAKEIGVSAPDKQKRLEKWVKEFKANLAKEIVPIERKKVWGLLKEMFKYPSKVIKPRAYKYITLNDVNLKH